MADEQNTQTGAVTGGTSTQTSGDATTPQTPPAPKENSVEDLLSMWASDDDVAVGAKNPDIKPAQLEKTTPSAPAPVAPAPTPAPAPAAPPVPPRPVAPQPPAPRPVAPTPSAPVPTPVVPAPRPMQPSPVAPAPAPSAPTPPRPPMPQAPAPVPAPVAPPAPRPVAPTPAPMPPSTVAPAPSASTPLVPTPTPRPMPGPGPLSPAPMAKPLPPAPAPAAPRPMTPPPAPSPSAPRPAVTPPPAPAPSAPRPAPVPPRPAPMAKPPSPQPLPSTPPPAPSRPQPVKKQESAAIEAELVDDEDDKNSAKAAAELLSSIKKQEDPSPGDDGEGFAAQFKELMQELNISPAKILRIIGCLAVFVGLVYAVYWAWGNYGDVILEKIGFNGSPQTQEPAPITPTPNVPNEGQQNTVENGIEGSVQVGQGIATEPIVIRDTGVQAAVLIGEATRAVTPFAKYITQFKLMENAYQVDINQLLNQSTDRRARFKSQLSLMNALYKEGNETLGAIQEEIDITNSELAKRTAEQNAAEAGFNEQMTALNGQVAEGLLSTFTRTAQQVVTLKARSRALQRLGALYANALPRFEARIRDLELNQEPLISGHKVYDVAGSDLELVVPVQTTQSVPRAVNPSNASRSTGGIVPIISPQEFKDVSGNDFITQPGGGF